MKTRRILRLFVISVFMLSILSGCKSAAEGKKNGIVIGTAMPQLDYKYLTYLNDAMKNSAKEQQVELKIADAKNDISNQLSQVEKFVVQGVDAIVMVPVDDSAVKPMVDVANRANIPMIVVNKQPTDPDVFKNIDAYVGSESLKSGIIQMEEVVKLLDGKGNVAIMTGLPGDEAQVKRTDGNKDVIKKHPHIKIVREGTAKWQRAEGMQLMENWIQSGDHIDAVVANNDEMAIGAIHALKSAGRLDDTLVAGIDGTPDALEYVRSGELKVSVFQDPVGQGQGAIETAIKLAKGEKLDNKMVWIPYELITKDNVEEYIEKWE